MYFFIEFHSYKIKFDSANKIRATIKIDIIVLMTSRKYFSNYVQKIYSI